MEQITKDFSDLTAMFNNNDIACTDIDMSTLGDKVNTLQDLIPIRITSIEEANREQGLFSDQPLPTADTKLLWHLQLGLHHLQRQF